MVNRLSGKRALITGGTRGIGQAIVREFLKEGATVVFTGSSMASIESAMQDPRLAGSRGIAANFSDLSLSFLDEVHDILGHLDILVNNAGTIGHGDFDTLSMEEWDRVHAVNLKIPFFVAQACARIMPAGGAVLNVSSIAGQNGGLAANAAYVSSKAGLIGVTRSMARHLALQNVRVNCLAPADIETDMTSGWSQELREKLISLTPLARFGSPEEVSAAAVFLCSDEASFITGQTLAINGGAWMH